ncbi:MAG: efflux RND transporter periplasmic adaptor subunit [Bacteroidaceae bacterium]|nr:efflux RND transporter periplasmic adaptor subunit [Bacteroidaceae bacterium]
MAKNKSELGLILKPILFITAVILIVGFIGILTLGKKSETIQGQVEVTEYRISSKVPGRIQQFYVQEGDPIKAGDTLVRLYAPDIEAKMEQARGAEAAAKAQDSKAKAGTRKEQVQGAYEMWKKAQAGLQIAEKTYDRMKRLFEEGVIAEQKLDEITAQRDAAAATEQAAKSQYQMALNGAQREDKEAAAALAERARGAVNEVESYIAETVLTAPADGEVSEVFPKAGELVGTGAPIMNVAQLQDLWVTFNVREDLLGELKMGNTVTGFIPALGDQEIKLCVYFIKDLGSFAVWKATKSTGQHDLRTFEVKARPLDAVKDLRPGMSVILKR